MQDYSYQTMDLMKTIWGKKCHWNHFLKHGYPVSISQHRKPLLAMNRKLMKFLAKNQTQYRLRLLLGLTRLMQLTICLCNNKKSFMRGFSKFFKFNAVVLPCWDRKMIPFHQTLKFKVWIDCQKLASNISYHQISHIPLETRISKDFNLYRTNYSFKSIYKKRIIQIMRAQLTG